jgi:importin subunit beta-1
VQIDSDDDEGDEWGCVVSAGCCLQKISLLIKNDVMPLVFPFIQENLQQADWKNRYAALLALGAIIDGPDQMKFKEVLVPGLQNLLNMFQD